MMKISFLSLNNGEAWTCLASLTDNQVSHKEEMFPLLKNFAQVLITFWIMKIRTLQRKPCGGHFGSTSLLDWSQI